jgi:hypothetical protein
VNPVTVLNPDASKETKNVIEADVSTKISYRDAVAGAGRVCKSSV